MKTWHVISRKAFSGLLLFLLCSTASFGQSSTDSAPRLALKGYDPVAYFTVSRPVKGIPAVTHDWDGARYQFASTEHRDAFAANPDRYAPQYSGFCAGGLSMGMKSEADPELWKIVDGKLYVFSSARAKKKLESDPEKTIAQSSANWKKVK